MKLRVLRVVVVAFITLQVVVPLAALAGPRPTRFGWQMFTAYVPTVMAWTEQLDGSLHSVYVEGLLLHPRAEADVSAALVARLCKDDSVAAVIVEQMGQRSRSTCA